VELLEQISASLQSGEDERVAALTRDALAAGLAPERILADGLLAGMAEVGQRFGAHEIFLPDVLLAARAMQAGIELLRPRLAQTGMPTLGRVVLGTVQGDIHDIGKNLVGIMLRGAGFEVIDLGCDVSAERFVEQAVAHDATVIGMSALLTTTMPAMKRVIDLLHSEGLAGRIRTIIGGAPVSQKFADQVGADAYGYDAANAVEKVSVLVAGP